MRPRVFDTISFFHASTRDELTALHGHSTIRGMEGARGVSIKH